MVEEDAVTTEISKYNEAQLQILRLHNLWLDWKKYFRENEFYYMTQTLESIWIELYADAKRKSPVLYFPGIEKIDEAIRKSRKNNTMLRQALKLKATFLKSLQDAVGKGGIYQDETEGEFE